jgi:hypothetical protein
MLLFKRVPWGPALVCTCALSVPVSTLAQVGQVGVASVAIGDPLSKPPQQAERVLRVGVDVFSNERISTKADDRAHLVFLDGSALTIGPSSELILDKFVFDPNTRAGDIAVSVSRGAFRFVGGAISKQKDVVVQTPSATIGIRGGIMIVSVGADNSTSVSFLYGRSATVTNRFGTSTAYRPGSQVVVPANGAPMAPALLPPGAVQALISRLEPAPGTAGTLGNPQTVDGLVNAFNSKVGPKSTNGGPSDFADSVRNNALQGANAIKQAGLLAFPGQPVVSSGGAASPSVPSTPITNRPPPVVTPPPPSCPPVQQYGHHQWRHQPRTAN